MRIFWLLFLFQFIPLMAQEGQGESPSSEKVNKITPEKSLPEGEVTEDQTPKFFRHIDVFLLFNTSYFNDSLPPDVEVKSQIPSVGPGVDILMNLGKPLDLYFYGTYGATKVASYQDTSFQYGVDNNYLLGLGFYFFKEFPTISPYLSIELEQQSFITGNENLDYSTVDIMTNLQSASVNSTNIVLGTDIPFHLFGQLGFFRILFSYSPWAKVGLSDGSYKEDINKMGQLGVEFKYFLHSSIFLDLLWKGGYFEGNNKTTFNDYYLFLGYRF